MENENTTTPPATTADAASAGSARPDPRAERAEAARRKRNTRGAFGKPKGARKVDANVENEAREPGAEGVGSSE